MSEYTIDSLAASVAGRLSAYSAAVSYAPEYELADLAETKCVVVPQTVEYINKSRGSVEVVYQVAVGILRRTKNTTMTALVEMMHNIIFLFLRKSLDDTMCIKATYAPLYDADMLRTRGQFTAVVNLTFKAVING